MLKEIFIVVSFDKRFVCATFSKGLALSVIKRLSTEIGVYGLYRIESVPFMYPYACEL